MISFKKFTLSMKNAFRGLGAAHAHEHSFRVHLLALAVLLILIIVLGIRGIEAAVLVLVAASVIVLELVNSIFERFVDIVSPRVGAQVRDAKDIMAAVVLIASLTAMVVGFIIIIPHLKL